MVTDQVIHEEISMTIPYHENHLQEKQHLLKRYLITIELRSLRNGETEEVCHG